MALPFIKAGKKSSLIGLFRRGEFTPRMWARLIESILTKDELEYWKDSFPYTYSDISSGDSDTDVTGAELEELTDGSDTTLHEHSYTYTDISGYDAATDVTGAELEELSDGSDTALHIHDSRYYTETETDAKYLPLTAGSGKPLTGDLYMSPPGNDIYITGGTAPFYRTRINQKVLEGIFRITLDQQTSGSSSIELNPEAADGSSDKKIKFFDGYATTGSVDFEIYDGGATGNIQHSFEGDTGDAELCQQAGELTISGGFTAPVTTQTAAALTLTDRHYTVLCDATSNAVTITLPAASGCTGRIYNIKAINTDNAVSVDPNGAEEIDGDSTTMTLSLMESITIQSDGSNWWII